MGLRALVGTESAGGHFEARRVQLDGCPTLTVPVLSALVHVVHRHDLPAAVERLMRNDWWRLHFQPHPIEGDWLIGDRSPNECEPHRGRLDGDDPGDLEWAYLFGGQRLHVYLAVHADGGREWEPFACWSVSELPHLPFLEIEDVQRRGYRRQWAARDFASYMRLVREHRIQEGVR